MSGTVLGAEDAMTSGIWSPALNSSCENLLAGLPGLDPFHLLHHEEYLVYFFVLCCFVRNLFISELITHLLLTHSSFLECCFKDYDAISGIGGKECSD